MQRIYICCNKKTTPVPQPSDPTTSRQRMDTAIHISSAYPFVEHLRLSIVPACSNLHVLVMLAYLGILLSAFDSYLCRGLVVSPQSFKPRPKRYSMSATLGHINIHA